MPNGKLGDGGAIQLGQAERKVRSADMPGVRPNRPQHSQIEWACQHLERSPATGVERPTHSASAREPRVAPTPRRRRLARRNGLDALTRAQAVASNRTFRVGWLQGSSSRAVRIRCAFTWKGLRSSIRAPSGSPATQDGGAAASGSGVGERSPRCHRKPIGRATCAHGHNGSASGGRRLDMEPPGLGTRGVQPEPQAEAAPRQINMAAGCQSAVQPSQGVGGRRSAKHRKPLRRSIAGQAESKLERH